MNKMKPKEMEGAKLCAPASFCVNRELKVFWSKKSDAHEDIIEEFDLHVDGVREANFVRVEVVPPKEGAFETPPDQWVFKLDQENAPSWYDKDKTEKACRIALVDWAAAKLALSGQVKTIKAGVLYACGSSAVTAYNKSTVIACDKSTVTACGSSTVTAYDSSTVTAYNKSTVTAYNKSTVTACGSSTVTACGSSTVTAYNSSTVTAYGSSTVTACGSSTVTAYDSSTVTAYGSSTVIACDKSTVREIIGGCVRFFCKFSVKISGKMSVAIDMTGDKAICHVGEDEPRVVTGGK